MNNDNAFERHRGYSHSSSPSSYSHHYVGSMYDDIRLHEAFTHYDSIEEKKLNHYVY